MGKNPRKSIKILENPIECHCRIELPQYPPKIPKILQKSLKFSQNPSKILQKSFKNPRKSFKNPRKSIKILENPIECHCRIELSQNPPKIPKILQKSLKFSQNQS